MAAEPVAGPADLAQSWAATRRIPLVMAAVLFVASFDFSLEWSRTIHHQAAWSTPVDLWGTFEAASELAHGHLGAVYLPAFGVVPLPGILVALLPVVVVVGVAHLTIGVPFSASAFPSAWLVVGPYATALAATTLFAADAVARHRDVPARTRWLLATGVAVALWNVLRFGHPELALGVALLLWAVDAALAGRWTRCGWLAGAAVALQPVTALVVPLLAVAAATEAGGIARGHTTARSARAATARSLRAAAALALRAATPGAALLVGPLVADTSRTLRAVLAQPSYPSIDHPTPWLALAPHLGPGTVATGPARTIAVAAALAVAALLGRGAAASPRRLLWAAAAALTGFAVFEPVMVAYYVFPGSCLALVAVAAPAAPVSLRHAAGRAGGPGLYATGRGAVNRGASGRLVVAVATVALLTWFTLVRLDGRWAWWAVVSAGMLVLLTLAAGPAGFTSARERVWRAVRPGRRRPGAPAR